MKFILFFIVLVSTSIYAKNDDSKWSLIYGHWGHAPLFGKNIEISKDRIVVFEYSNESYPNVRAECRTTYEKIEIYQASTRTPGKKINEYGVFVINMTNSCGLSEDKGVILILAIPNNHLCHARVSILDSIDDLPKIRPHRVENSIYMPKGVRSSSGYGLRHPFRECWPGYVDPDTVGMQNVIFRLLDHERNPNKNMHPTHNPSRLLQRTQKSRQLVSR